MRYQNGKSDPVIQWHQLLLLAFNGKTIDDQTTIG
jgi:hypothetical protein